jgi:hypothetical protein
MISVESEKGLETFSAFYGLSIFFSSSNGKIMRVPIIERPAQHAHSTLIIFGTFSATSIGKRPVTGSGSSCLGFTIAVEMKLKMKAPKPKPARTIPPTSPLLSGKYLQLLQIGTIYYTYKSCSVQICHCKLQSHLHRGRKNPKSFSYKMKRKLPPARSHCRWPFRSFH